MSLEHLLILTPDQQLTAVKVANIVRTVVRRVGAALDFSEGCSVEDCVFSQLLPNQKERVREEWINQVCLLKH